MIAPVGASSDMGWGDLDSDDRSSWGAGASAALIVATGLYWGSLWVLGGLAPLPQLALRRLSAPRTADAGVSAAADARR